MLRAIGAVLSGLRFRLTKRSPRRRHTAQLRNLCDAMLRDIGLSPSTISPAAFGSVHPHRRNPHY